jgi:GNAT superfamily N-acetyltransferase
MTATIRAPRITEWPACRMLIPNSFTGGAPPEFRLAVQDAYPHIIGAASFRRYGATMHSVMVHVVPQYRRQSIGSALLRQLLEEAGREGCREATAQVDVEADPGTELFLLAHQFLRGERLYSVEGDLARMRPTVCALRDRLLASGRIPPAARVVPLASSHWDSVLELFADHIARSPFINPQFMPLIPEMLPLSRILLVENRVEGMILAHLEEEVVKTHGLVVTPPFRKSWAVVLLLSEAIESAWDAGARRTQFDFLENNIQRNMARRFQTKVIRILASYVRPIKSHENGT